MPDDVRSAIEAANKQFMALFDAGDLERLANCYTEQAQFLAPGHEPFTGRPAIAGLLGGLKGDGNTLSLETLEVEAMGDAAWEAGRYTVRTAAAAVADRGKYIVIWKHEAGEWRLHRDITNTSQPQPAA